MRSNSLAVLSKEQSSSQVQYGLGDFEKSIKDDVLNIFARIKIVEDNTQKRLDVIEEKINKLLEEKTTTKEISIKPVTTKLDNMNKKLVQLESAIEKLAEKFIQE